MNRQQLQDRLFGDGGEDGGMPLLPSLSQRMLEVIADRSDVMVADLLPVARHELTSQGRLLAARYAAEDPVAAYVQDLLAWLRLQGIVAGNGDGPWELAAKFSYGQSMTIRPHREKRRRITVTVYEQAERVRRSEDSESRRLLRQLIHGGVRGPGKDQELEELAWSMREFGIDPRAWVPVADQHGTVLTGNRRLSAAKMAGVELEPRTVSFPDTLEGDRERLRLAIASNLGTRKLTAEDRGRIAQYLQLEGWSQQNIAAALGVSQQQVSRDITQMSNVAPIPENGNGPATDSDSPPSPPKSGSRVTEEGKAAAFALFKQGITGRERVATAVTELLGPGHLSKYQVQDLLRDWRTAEAAREEVRKELLSARSDAAESGTAASRQADAETEVEDEPAPDIPEAALALPDTVPESVPCVHEWIRVCRHCGEAAAE